MAGRRGCQHAAGDELGHGGSGRQARKQRWFVPRPPVALAGAKSAGDGPAACGRRRRQGSDAEGAAGGEGGGMEVWGSCGTTRGVPSRLEMGRRRVGDSGGRGATWRGLSAAREEGWRCGGAVDLGHRVGSGEGNGGGGLQDMSATRGGRRGRCRR